MPALASNSTQVSMFSGEALAPDWSYRLGVPQLPGSLGGGGGGGHQDSSAPGGAVHSQNPQEMSQLRAGTGRARDKARRVRYESRVATHYPA